MYEPLSDQRGPPDVYVRSAPPPPPTQKLDGPRHFAVAIIGAGFTGLSTALHVAEAGDEVAVLEAKEIGSGASGRAFGQVVPYLKLAEPAVLRHYGEERGQRIIDAVAAGPDLVFELIMRHGIECWALAARSSSEGQLPRNSERGSSWKEFASTVKGSTWNGTSTRLSRGRFIRNRRCDRCRAENCC